MIFIFLKFGTFHRQTTILSLGHAWCLPLIFRMTFSPHMPFPYSLFPFFPLYMQTACVWCILLDLSVVFFFFCFLYINFCSDSFDIFGTFFTSVKFFASCTPVFYLFDTRFPLLCYQNDRKCQKCQLCHVIFYPSFFFFRTLCSKTQR